MTLVDCGVFEDMFVLFGLGQRIELCTEQSTVKQTHCCEQSRKTSQINLTNWTRIKSKGIKRNRGESQGGFISFHFISSDQRAQDQERDWTVEVCLTCKGHPKHGVFTVQTVHNVHQWSSMIINDHQCTVEKESKGYRLRVEKLVACWLSPLHCSHPHALTASQASTAHGSNIGTGFQFHNAKMLLSFPPCSVLQILWTLSRR